jgi:alkylation response protein AidB-like acyl-CoA dehydrogenase
MEFALTEEQQMLQQTIQSFLTDASPLDQVRKAAEGDRTVARTIDAGLTELGVSGIMIAEEYGGLGLGLVEAALVQEMIGGAVSPAAFLAQCLAAVGIAAAGSEEQKAEYLPKIASGEIRFGVALSERVGARDAAGVRVAGDKITGTALFALEADEASHLLVPGPDGQLHIVLIAASAVTSANMNTIDRSRNFTEITFDGADALALSGENEPGLAADQMIAVGRVLLAADTLGASQYMLDAAVAYAKEREQFGRVIGSFQAVKHMCAEMAAKLEPSRALVWHAAYAWQSGDEEGALLSCLVKSHLSDAGTFIARTSTEVHGGMGFTDLVGLHYWFKRIGANRQLLGGPEKVRSDAARLQGFGQAA